MKITLWTSGPAKPKELNQLVNQYLDRLPPSWHAQIHPYVDPEEVLLLPVNHCLLFDERGKILSTNNFRSKVEQSLAHSDDMNLLFGPPNGWTENIRKRFSESHALSGCVLAHDLALLLVSEQLFRVWSMISNHPYHRV